MCKEVKRLERYDVSTKNGVLQIVSNLLPCPFCGGEAKVVVTEIEDNEHRIQCSNCHVRTSDDYDHFPSEFWNKRNGC